MKSRYPFGFTLSLLMLLGTAVSADTVKLKMHEGGVAQNFVRLRPQQIELGLTPPAALKKRPEKGALAYGTLRIGPKESPTTTIVAIDEGKTPHLYVDTNNNGDLTDDPPTEWKATPYKSRDGKDLTLYTGSGTVQVRYGEETIPLRLAFTRFDRNDPDRALLNGALLYTVDYGPEGEITLGGKTYRALLADMLTTGDFRGTGGTNASGVFLLIDVNGNGVFDRRGEMFDIAAPFNIKGTTYEIKGMSASGTAFDVVKSDRSVPEIPPSPDLRIGKIAPAFEKKTTDGQTIAFPSHYKGKHVLLYFWATWCPSCVAQVPYVNKAYDTYHAQGLEVLGISLDHPNNATQLAAFTRKNHMPWSQVYDGKFLDADIAQLYDIAHTPTAYLIDGDTGAVLASGADLRDDRLSETIKEALTRHASPPNPSPKGKGSN
jgi:peroxiredoxin